uniref:N-ribosyldihydronicotinamide:quinone dehydrogenase 2 n=1 Tax=Felis catus TaxID=9685 RepID=A0ABI7XUU9_FELCA
MNLVRRAALSQFLTCMPWTLSRGPPGKISLELILEYIWPVQILLSLFTVIRTAPVSAIGSTYGAVSNPEFFNYGVEAYEAFKKGALTSDIIDEQKKVQEADLVIFQFPLYWFSMPAILKGWMDRVLCQGFAFDIPGFYDSGFLKNKLALLSLTTGSTAEMYMKTGVSGDYRYFLWPLQHGALHFCGFKVLAPQISFAPEIASEEERKAMVASWAQRLKTIWEEEPIDCTPPWYFGQ